MSTTFDEQIHKLNKLHLLTRFLAMATTNSKPYIVSLLNLETSITNIKHPLDYCGSHVWSSKGVYVNPLQHMNILSKMIGPQSLH